jgi:transcriptional regulator with XRE-family HTH domain
MAKSSDAEIHLVDATVGRRLRDRRTVMGLSQSALGDAVGLTFQQVQKYERGINRVSASRLYEFAAILQVSVDYFFEPLLYDEDSHELLPPGSDDPTRMREILALVRAYYAIEDSNVRRGVFELTKSLADE